jgi:hypothetical protein
MKCSVCGKDAKTTLCLVCQLEEVEYHCDEKQIVRSKPQARKAKEVSDD